MFSASPKNIHKKFKVLNHKNTEKDPNCFDRVLEHFENKRKTSHNAMDGIELLMMGHAKTIKKFSARRQAIAKNEIAKLIGELELEQIDEDSYPPTTSSSSQSSHYNISLVTPIISNYSGTDNSDELQTTYYAL